MWSEFPVEIKAVVIGILGSGIFTIIAAFIQRSRPAISGFFGFALNFSAGVLGAGAALLIYTVWFTPTEKPFDYELLSCAIKYHFKDDIDRCVETHEIPSAELICVRHGGRWDGKDCRKPN